MKKVFDFANIENCETIIKKTWDEFREGLANGIFSYKEIDKARQYTFLKVYDDLFRQNLGISHNTITIKEIKTELLGRGAILNNEEIPDFERFLPKKEFIKEDNRFSPPGVEWLYLSIGKEKEIHQCTQLECRAKKEDRFGFCYFKFCDKYDDEKLVNLTIADDLSYAEINQSLEEYRQAQLKKGKKIAKTLGHAPKGIVNPKEFQEKFTRWTVYTYTKLLSEQIFIPLDSSGNKSITYAPFQTMAQYYISLGYAGIIYGSTVCANGKNIVLFDKQMAYPVGVIEDYKIS